MENRTPATPLGPLSSSVTLKSVRTVPTATPSEMEARVRGLRNMGMMSLKSSTVMLISTTAVCRTCAVTTGAGTNSQHANYRCSTHGMKL